MESWLTKLGSIKNNMLVFIKWLLLSCFVGMLVGICGVLFHEATEYGGMLREKFWWFLLLLPVAGLLIVFCYRKCGMKNDRGTNYVMVAVRENEPMHLRTAPLIFIATALTQLCGGSAGREGAALQMGGAIANTLGEIFHLDEKDLRVMTMCGMAAGFSALFGTPIASAVFAMEVVSVGVMYYAAIVPCILASLIAYLTAQACGIQESTFFMGSVPVLSMGTVLRVILLGVLCAVVAVYICRVFGMAHRLFTHHVPNPYLRIMTGSFIVIVFSLLARNGDYNGMGLGVIENAVGGSAHPGAFLLKLVFTAVTLGAGFKGGEIVPTFFIGATFGCTAGALLGLPAGFAGALGLTAVFCGVTNCPLTSVILAFELFGGGGLPLFALICAVSYMLSGYSGLYSEQRIVYSKLRAELHRL